MNYVFLHGDYSTLKKLLTKFYLYYYCCYLMLYCGGHLDLTLRSVELREYLMVLLSFESCYCDSNIEL